MRKKSNVISTVVLIIILLVGLSVMLYPTFSDWWNTRQQNYAIVNYQTAVSEMDDSETERILAEARAYNESLNQVYSPFSNYDEVEGYEDILDITGTGIMGYISIPVIDVELPIYHGTSSEVLNVAVGHLQGSSLPVGGADTHAVISAHRGLPSARLSSLTSTSLLRGIRSQLRFSMRFSPTRWRIFSSCCQRSLISLR